MVGKSHYDLTAAAEVHNAVKKVIETAEKHSGEVEYTFHSGEKGDYEYICTPVLDDEKKIEAVAERDITDRIISAEKLRRTKEQLQTLNNELEQRVERRSHELQKAQAQYLHSVKLSAIGQLSASIAHEFNNPLQGTKTILKGLKRRAILDEEDKELLDLAIGENERMEKLIKDNGVGFAPEKKDEIFMPFFTTKPKEEGTGLGLSISKEIIQCHQGEIRVESQPGKGSTFTILLPVKGD